MPKPKLNPLIRSWGSLDLLVAIAALALGLAIWFIPNFRESPEMKQLIATQAELKQKRLAYEAAQARIAKEREEQGLVLLAPVPGVATEPAAPPPARDSTAP